MVTSGPDATVIEAELTRLEIRLFANLDHLIDDARRLEADARRRGLVGLALRARLVEADALARTGEIPAAIAMMSEARDEAATAGDGVALGRSHALLATSLDQLGERARSLAEAEAAFELLDEQTPLHLRVDHTMVFALVTSLHRSAAVSFDLFGRSLELAQELGEPILIVAVLNNMAWLRCENGDLAEARRCADELVTIARASTIALPLVVVDTVARCMAETGQREAAEALLQAALHGPVPAPDTDISSLPAALHTLAIIARRDGRQGEARSLLERCRSLSADGCLYRKEAEALADLAAIYAEEGDFERAYAAYRIFHERWEHLRALEAEAEAAAMQAMHGTLVARQRSSELEQLARRDPLTGLWNRRYLGDQMPGLVLEARRSGQALSIALGDIDGFKTVNDRLSHAAGDRVLVAAARLLEQLVDGCGFAVRFGGEEFLAVLPGSDLGTTASFAARWCEAVRSHPWRDEAGIAGLTMSIGLATLGPGDDVAALMAAADRQMYAAKRAGRDRVSQPR